MKKKRINKKEFERIQRNKKRETEFVEREINGEIRKLRKSKVNLIFIDIESFNEIPEITPSDYFKLMENRRCEKHISDINCLKDEENRCAYIDYRTLKRVCNKFNAWHINDGETWKEYDFDFDEDEPTLQGLDYLYVYDKTFENVIVEVCLMTDYCTCAEAMKEVKMITSKYNLIYIEDEDYDHLLDDSIDNPTGKFVEY